MSPPRRRPPEPRRLIAWDAPLRLVAALVDLARREGSSVSGILEGVVMIGLRNLGERVADIPGVLPPGALDARPISLVTTPEQRKAWQARSLLAWAKLRDRGIPIAEAGRRAGVTYHTAVRALHARQVCRRVTEAAEELAGEWDAVNPPTKTWPGPGPKGGRPRKEVEDAGAPDVPGA